MRVWIMAAAAMFASPAAAQLKRSGDYLSLPAAGVRIPTRAAATTVVETGEFSHKGEGLDTFAKYESADRLVFATAYVYMPALADASLTAYATDRAVRLRFGPGVRVAEQASVAFAGRPGTAIRSVYAGGELAAGKPLVTAAAFAHVGRWMVKLRATGPADRQTEVTGALDALLAGITLDRKVRPMATRPLAFDAPCPVAPGAREANALPDQGIGADALIGAVLGSDIVSVTKAGEAAPAPFPGEGATRACVRGTLRLNDADFDIIQPAGEPDPSVTLIALSDAGDILSIRRGVVDPGYLIRSYAVGRVDTFGRLDAQPTPAQLRAWMGDRGALAMVLRSRATLDAKGNQKLQLPGRN